MTNIPRFREDPFVIPDDIKALLSTEQSFKNEYKNLTKNNIITLAKDINNKYHEVTYTKDKGWYNEETDTYFPYMYVEYYKKDDTNIPEISHEKAPSCISLYDENEQTPDDITLSVIINVCDNTNITRFAILLASMCCEIMKPLVFKAELYEKILNLSSITDINNINFEQIINVIHQTLPSKIVSIPSKQVQLILALDNLNKADGRKKVKQTFIDFCKFANIDNYLILNPHQNVGLTGMRNIGSEYATEDFIIFRDDDDMSSSLDSIIRQCADYDTEKWAKNTILHINCANLPTHITLKRGTWGYWDLIFPKSLKKYINSLAIPNAFQEDLFEQFCLCVSGLLYNEWKIGYLNALIDLDNISFLIDFINSGSNNLSINFSTGALSMSYANKTCNVKLDSICYLYLGYIINLYMQNKDFMPKSEFNEFIKRIQTVFNNLKSYTTYTEKDTNEDNHKTFMYIYCLVSNRCTLNNKYMHYRRIKALMDYIIPNNNFELSSSSDILIDNVGPITYKYNPETINYIHPDEIRVITVEDKNGNIKKDMKYVETLINSPKKEIPKNIDENTVDTYNINLKKNY